MTETTDSQLVAVWEAMADHFLDTETRQDLPMTALRCVEAGLSGARYDNCSRMSAVHPCSRIGGSDEHDQA